MATRGEIGLREKLLFLILSLTAFLMSWFAVRLWLLTTSLVNIGTVHLIDVAVVAGAGVLTVALVTRWMSRPLISYVGPTETNAVKLLFQLVGLSLVLLAIAFVTGTNLISTLMGVGFFGLVIGLAAQSVLGNLISGMMLLAARPFHINDRIALITWQYGKFPPSLAHGWLEPSYTGVVKSISLTYTRIQTDSDTILTVPNALVTQSLIMNLSHDREGHIATQFQAPIHVDPDDLQKKIRLELSHKSRFLGKEQSFEVLDISPSEYLVAVLYRVEKGRRKRDENTTSQVDTVGTHSVSQQEWRRVDS